MDVDYVANLARLNLTPEEAKLFSAQLKDILTYVDKLKKAGIKGIPATSHVLPLENVFREDKVKPSLSASEALKNAPSKKGNFFKVPKVIE